MMDPFVKQSRRLSLFLRMMFFIIGTALSGCTGNPYYYIHPILDGHETSEGFVAQPFGMVRLGPVAEAANKIKGFSHLKCISQNPTGVDGLLITPMSGTLILDTFVISTVNPRKERREPGYFCTFLEEGDILAELTATLRTGVHRYTFPAAQPAHIVISPGYQPTGTLIGAGISLVSNTEIRGFKHYLTPEGDNQYLFFIAVFSMPASKSDILLDNGTIASTSDETGKKLKAFATFMNHNGKPIEMKVAFSFSSYKGAWRNLEQEAQEKPFEKIRKENTLAWKEALDHINVKGTPQQKKVFYSNLYQAGLEPSVYWDVDGRYRINTKIKRDKLLLKKENNKSIIINGLDNLSNGKDFKFPSIGLYTVPFETDKIYFGIPSVDVAQFQLPNGNWFTIECKKALKQMDYINKAAFNSQPVSEAFICMDKFMEGGNMVLWLGKKPENQGNPAYLSEQSIPLK